MATYVDPSAPLVMELLRRQQNNLLLKHVAFMGISMIIAKLITKEGKRRSASPRTESGEGWTSILSGSRPRRVDPVVAKVQQEQQSVLSALKGLTASDFAPVPEGPQTLERRSAGEHSRMSREKLEERIAENENKIRDAKEQIRELDEEEAALTRKLRQIIEREKETRLDRFARMILKSGLSMTEVRERLGLPRKEG